MRFGLLTALLLTPCMAVAQQVPECNLSAGANYSSNSVGTSSMTLIPPNPNSPSVRSGFFLQCLTPNCILWVNATGQAAASGVAGNFFVNGQGGYLNAVALGFIPKGPINVIANAPATAVTAFACPQ